MKTKKWKETDISSKNFVLTEIHLFIHQSIYACMHPYLSLPICLYIYLFSLSVSHLPITYSFAVLSSILLFTSSNHPTTHQLICLLHQSINLLIQQIFGSTIWEDPLSEVAQMVKHLPAMWEAQVQPLGCEDPLEKEMATHSSTLGWKIPWTEEPGRLQSMRLQRVRRDWMTSLHFTSLLRGAKPHNGSCGWVIRKIPLGL